MEYILIFLVGLVVGSFLNVCIDRIPKGESVIYPPSHCDSCGERLKFIDLLPILGFLLAGGCCRYCGARIGVRQPVVELAAGFLLVGLDHLYGAGFLFLGRTILVCLLLVAGIIDWNCLRIPNPLIIFGFGVGLLLLVAGGTTEIKDAVAGTLAGGLPLLVLAIVTRGGMGGGDVKLAALVGFYLGWKLVLEVIFLSALLGCIVWLLLMRVGLKTRKDPLPFGSFMALGVFLVCFRSYFFGSEAVNYFKLN